MRNRYHPRSVPSENLPAPAMHLSPATDIAPNMTQFAVTDLIGESLDMAVALADGHPVRRSAIEHAPGIHEQWPGGNWEWIRKPSTAWAHGGPIIERERMALDYLDDEWHDWTPTARKSNGEGSDATGPTPLGVWAAEGIEIAEEKFEAPESRWLDFSDQGNGAATPKNAGF